MPYYLVTHTSIVEGDDEVKAAEKVLANLRFDDVVQFVVKYDEATVKTVVIANHVAGQEPSPAAREALPVVSLSTGITGLGMAQDEPSARPQASNLSRRTIAAGAALFVAGTLLGPLLSVLD